ncbi:NAD(P)HX epimerase / NAD(P)HX dehydratase [Desulfocucumis palustris]|uniref:Bifunctional NAD(P)H-hydrate repair enzyme n=1 Tax=Desulfocucumis palustris TaxID=1898651 RepID=A0A2L2X8I0_9FIRM|nr:NAD(P)H-hydrate dehydratase [Desulfocucumis palustris]GBF31883.1 NAD(P)HX epimerase / NAD(P)HX dehydratase [Desulfocucumis palustris]
MRIATAREMREIDLAAINRYGIPGVVLMENAGLHVANAVRAMLGNVRDRVVTIFAGKGNNGGDGLVAARHLHNSGARVKVLLLARPEEITGDAAVNFNIWINMGQDVYSITQDSEFDPVRLFLAETDLVVDAIYGTGFRGKVNDLAGRVMEAVNAGGKPVVSVDIPSGVEADTGKVNGACIRAGATVTFGLPKLGLLFHPGAGCAGKIKIADISIPPALLGNDGLKRHLLGRKMVRGWLPGRAADSHKGNYGSVLVVAGSAGMTGAACLAAEAAARTGAGLVTLAVPEGLHQIVETKLTEVMTYPLPQEKSQSLSPEALPVIMSLLDKADVLALGPGLSTNPGTARLVRELLGKISAPCVLDADGLNALAGHTDIFKKAGAPLVLTPHPGEMARLTGLSTADIARDRLAGAEKYSSLWQSVLVLKGAPSLVAAPGGNVYVNSTGNPGMAAGGSGDVLTGIIAGLLAQGLSPERAAAAGVYLHGFAGDRAAARKGMMGLLAGDILLALPEVLREMEAEVFRA